MSKAKKSPVKPVEVSALHSTGVAGIDALMMPEGSPLEGGKDVAALHLDQIKALQALSIFIPLKPIEWRWSAKVTGKGKKQTVNVEQVKYYCMPQREFDAFLRWAKLGSDLLDKLPKEEAEKLKKWANEGEGDDVGERNLQSEIRGMVAAKGTMQPADIVKQLSEEHAQTDISWALLRLLDHDNPDPLIMNSDGSISPRKKPGKKKDG